MTVWTLGCIVFNNSVNHYAIRPLIPGKKIVKHLWVEIMRRSLSWSFTEIVFFNFYCLSVSDSLLHIWSNSSSCHNVFSVNLFIIMFQTWAYSLVFVQLACWHTDVSRWSGVQPWQLSPFHRRKHYWCAHMSLTANFQCFYCVVLVPFCIICSLHLIAVWFFQAIWLLE